MKIHLRITGGMGLTLSGAVDVAELPTTLQAEVASLLTPENLAPIEGMKPSAQAVDLREFELTIASDTAASDAEALESNEAQRFRFTETDENIEIVDLLDALMREIVLRKQAGQ